MGEMTGSRRSGLVTACLLGLATAVVGVPSATSAEPPATTRVSVRSNGAQANLGGGGAATSANGRYVAFSSASTNLMRRDTNNKTDVFIRDLSTGATRRVSVSNDERQANGHSRSADVWANGRYVAFESRASNLVRGDTNRTWDVFVRDRWTGTTKRVSITDRERQRANGSYAPTVSATGRYVAFESNIGSPSVIFVRDRTAGTTRRVPSPDGRWTHEPDISANGRYIAFSGMDVPGPLGLEYTQSNVYVYDRVNRTTHLVASPAHASSPSISADGAYVAFESSDAVESEHAPGNLRLSDVREIFVRALATGTTERVSVRSNGQPSGGYALDPQISADGRYVAFTEYSALVPADGNGVPDVYLRDRTAGTTERISVSSAGTEANGGSGAAAISANGRYVAFESSASNLVPNDTNGASDVFLRDRGLG